MLVPVLGLVLEWCQLIICKTQQKFLLLEPDLADIQNEMLHLPFAARSDVHHLLKGDSEYHFTFRQSPADHV